MMVGHATRDASPRSGVKAIRLALPARRDLLLEVLALRHQSAVLTRSNRRFRAPDRLLWLMLRSMWPQWRDALLLGSTRLCD
jgi:hypothetical protein